MRPRAAEVVGPYGVHRTGFCIFVGAAHRAARSSNPNSKNADTFPPLCGGKVLAALAERLAKQGIQGIRSHSRRAAAPLSSPANTRADSSKQRFFGKLGGLAFQCRASVFEDF